MKDPSESPDITPTQEDDYEDEDEEQEESSNNDDIQSFVTAADNETDRLKDDLEDLTLGHDEDGETLI